MSDHPFHPAHDHRHNNDHDHLHAPALRTVSAPRFNLIALAGMERVLLILPPILALWLATIWAIT